MGTENKKAKYNTERQLIKELGELRQRVAEEEKIEIERNQVKEALGESEDRFRVLSDACFEAIVVHEDGVVLQANDQYFDMFGYEPHELLGKQAFPKTLAPESIDYVKERIAAGDLGAYEATGVRKDGTRFPIEIRVRLMEHHGRMVRIGVIRDLTERKQAEEALQKAKDTLEQRVEERTIELVKANELLMQEIQQRKQAEEELRRKQQQLLNRELNLAKLNEELVETNRALSVLARNIDREKDEAEKRIALTITSKVMPILEELQKDKICEGRRAELDVLIAYMNDLTSGLADGKDILYFLSPTELRVAMMIKNGLTSQEIARQMHISLDTVKTHRRNIRKKLSIQNSDINLNTYLRFKME